MNSQVTLTKNHIDKVCEGYFEEEKTWYAALVMDVKEDKQEAEIAWIGMKLQTSVPKKYINIL